MNACEHQQETGEAACHHTFPCHNAPALSLRLDLGHNGRAESDLGRWLGDVDRDIDTRQRHQNRGTGWGRGRRMTYKNGKNGRHGETAERDQLAASQEPSDHDHPQRSAEPHRSDSDEPTLARLWSLVSPVLLSGLVEQGVNLHDAEEVTQEVGVRAFASGRTFRSRRDLLRWCSLVAHRLLRDMAAKDEHAWPLALARYAPDAAEVVESQFVLRAALSAVDELADGDKEIITLDFRGERWSEDQDERNRQSVRLHRAHKRLKDRLNGLLGIAPAWRWRWWWGHARQIADTAGPVCIAICLAAGIGAMSQSGPPRARPVLALSDASSGPVPADRATASADTAGAHGQVISSDQATAGASRSSGKRPVDVPWPVEHQRVEVRVPGSDDWVAAATREKREDQPILCFAHFPVLGSRCIPQPLP